jgi:hypothetical protein
MTLLRRSAVAFVASLALVACSSDTATAPPDLQMLYTDGEDLPGEVEVCKVGPDGTTATFTITQSPAGVGTMMVSSPFTLEAHDGSQLNKCRVVWRSSSSSAPPTTLTITETDATAGTVLSSIVVFGGLTTPTVNLASKSVAVSVGYSMGAYVIFKNVPGDTPPPPPPPPPPAKGCTPGYWKVKPHLDSWPATGFTTGQSFQSAFGVNAFPGMTLHQVVSQGGGQLKALGRHTVAALLNSAHPGVPYGLTTAQVIGAFQAAYASGDYEATKSIFETLNEMGCSIN